MVEARGSVAGAAQADLVDRLGRDRVSLGEAARLLAGFDPAGREGPVAVVRPNSVEHVEHIVKVGRTRHLPIEVRSRLPALVPDELSGSIVIDSTGLHRPPAIDISRRVATVGAGVEVGAIDRASRQARLCLRGMPSLHANETIGAVLGAGECGELGLGDGSLLTDIVSALVVTGGGRALRLGGSDLFGQTPWLGEGVPNPLPLLLASEGRMAILCEVTVRLHPAPHVAWSAVKLAGGRPNLLAVLSGARAAMSARLCDSVLIAETSDSIQVHVRAATWRGEDDLPATTSLASAAFARHKVSLGAWRDEEKRVRLGQQAGEWPKPVAAHAPATLDLRVAWPDVPGVLDVIDALYAEAGEVPVRAWAVGGSYLRLRCDLQSVRADVHPLVQRVHHLLDAGAVPIATGSRLRNAARERMPPAAKVLLTALARAWDPEGVLSPRTGVI